MKLLECRVLQNSVRVYILWNVYIAVMCVIEHSGTHVV